MNQSSSTIAQRVAGVREKIEVAAARAGVPADSITLVGVTKTQPVESVRQLIQAGVTTIGENRVQELLEKQPQLADLPHEAHLIGHLQRNKAKYLPGKISMLQSLDDEKTIEALEKSFGGAGLKLDVLVEVNIGGEESKTGITPDMLLPLCERVCQSEILTLRGLMAIPPFVEGEQVRRYFAQMRKLFVDIKAQKMDNNTVNILSMGMSADYEYAILEGANMIRVGTELFGPRVY